MISPRLLISVATIPVAVGSAGGNTATMWRLGTQTSYSNVPVWWLKPLTRSTPWSLIADAKPSKAVNVAAIRPDAADHMVGRLTFPLRIAPAISPSLLIPVANRLVDGGASRNVIPSLNDHVNARW